MSGELEHYSRKYVAGIKRQAKLQYNATAVSHVRPRAYCVAKPAPAFFLACS